MGTPMSATPSWAMTAPSTYSTIECTIDCGWMTTWTRSAATSNSQRASMISRPLFISVAFVHQRGRIDGDLRTHLPRGMAKRVLHGDAREGRARQLAEGAARARQQDALDIGAIV